MSFRRSDLQEAFFVPGTHAFRVWGYGTTDPLEEVSDLTISSSPADSCARAS
jgi:hypothetical protein